MYRKSEYILLNGLAWFSSAAILGSILMVVLYLFHPMVLYRTFATVLLIFSLLFQLQVFMYKFAVIEKRMLHLVELSEQHFAVASRRWTLDIVAFFALFWVALIGVIVVFALYK